MAFIAGGKSFSTQNQFINALKLYCKYHGQGQIVAQTLKRPRKEQKLPEVLTANEVKRLLLKVKKLKRQTLLSLVYACGLRIGEALKLNVADVRAEEQLIYIRAGKGRKERRVPLSAGVTASSTRI